MSLGLYKSQDLITGSNPLQPCARSVNSDTIICHPLYLRIHPLDRSERLLLDQSVSVGHLRKFPMSHLPSAMAIFVEYGMTNCLFVRAFVRPFFSGDFMESENCNNCTGLSIGHSVSQSFIRSVIWPVIRFIGHSVGRSVIHSVSRLVSH